MKARLCELKAKQSSNITFDKPFGGGLIISKSGRNVVLKGTNDYTGDVFIAGGYNEAENRKGIVYLGHATGSFEKDKYGNDLIENTSSVYIGMDSSLRVPDLKVYADRVSMIQPLKRLKPTWESTSSIPHLWDSLRYHIAGNWGIGSPFGSGIEINTFGTNKWNLLIESVDYDRMIILNALGQQDYNGDHWVYQCHAHYKFIITNTDDYLVNNNVYNSNNLNLVGGNLLTSINLRPHVERGQHVNNDAGQDNKNVSFFLPKGYKILVSEGELGGHIGSQSNKKFFLLIEGWEQKLGL